MTESYCQLDIFNDGFKECAVELSAHEQKIIRDAFRILERTLRKPGAAMSKPELVSNYLKLTIAAKPHEVFTVMFLDNQNSLIETQEMFRGTINQASVYPREIVKEALRLNASGCILAHNHPSGITEPSECDKVITQKIKQALELIEVRTLDHIVIGGTAHMSFAERGLMP